MKKLYSLLAAVIVSATAYSQATLPYNETFTYANGNLLGNGNWVLQGSAGTDEIQVIGGVAKFDGAGSDLQQLITSTNSGTIYYSMNVNVTNTIAATLANGGYFAGFNQDATTFGGTLWTKKITDSTYKLGIEVRTAAGATTTWTTADYNINQVYSVIVGYTFGPTAGDDVTTLWVNGVLAATDTHAGTDLNPIVGFFLRQDSTTETPFIEVDNLRISTVLADVLGVSDVSNLNSNFVRNTMVNDEISFGTKSDVKVYNMNGQVVKSASVSANKNLNVAELQNGMYIVTGTVNGTPVSQKILKK